MGTEHTNFEFSPTRGVFVSLGTTHTHACTVCVCTYTHLEKDNRSKARTVYTSICLNANGLRVQQLSVIWTYPVQGQKLSSSSCFMFTSL